MRFSLKIVVFAVLALALTVPQASAEPTNHPSSSYVQKKAKKVKIKVVAKGDCAQNPATILITDSTTTCSIQISFTPPTSYSFDIGPISPYNSGELILFRSYLVGAKNYGSLKTSAKGKATANVSKTEEYGGIYYPITNWTEEVYVWYGYDRSKPITITFQQSIPASGCGYVYFDKDMQQEALVPCK